MDVIARGCCKGVCEKLLDALIKQDIMDESTPMLDSATIKVHLHASGSKKGEHEEETERSRGGLTMKVNVVTDGLGNPLKFYYPAETATASSLRRSFLNPLTCGASLSSPTGL